MRTIYSAVVWLLLASVASAQPAPSYARQVQPFLAKYCLECHNAKAQKGGLSLESYATLRAGGDSGAVLEPGQPDRSRLVLLAEGKDKPAMPPKKARQPQRDEVAVLRAWVQSGAKDDSTGLKVELPAIQPRHTLLPPVTGLVFHPRAAVLVVARGAALQFLDLETGQLRPDDVKVPGPITAVACAPKTALFAIAHAKAGVSGHGRLARLPDTPGRPGDPAPEASADLDLHKDAILDLAFSPDGSTLATSSYDTRVKLVDVAARVERAVLREHSDAVYGVAFSPDGKLLATCSADRAVKIWDVASGRLRYTLSDATDWLYAVAWSPDGKRLAAAGIDKSIRLYEPGPGEARLVQSVFAHEAAVLKLMFAPDSRTLFSLGEDRVAKAWDVERMIERRVYPRQKESLLCFALSPDGKQLALGRYDGAVVLLDVESGKVAQPTPPAPPDVTKVTPNHGTRGKTVRVEIEGQHLARVDEVRVSAPGSTAKIAERAEGRLVLDLALAPGLRAGNYTLEVAGCKTALAFHVDAFDAIPEKDAGDSPGQGQKISLPASIAGVLDRAGDIDFFRFDVNAGQELGVHVVPETAGKLEPFLQVCDMSGQVLAQGSAGYLGHTFAEAGTYSLAVRDRDYRGGADLRYRLHVGPLPVVTSVFPLGMQRGSSGNVTVEGVFLDQRQVHVDIPRDAAVGSFVPVPVKASSESPLGDPRLVVGEFPEVVAAAAPVPVPGTANGVLSKPGQADLRRFVAKKGQRLVVETQAGRLGSPLDSFIELLDESGKPVPRAVLRCLAKSHVTFRDHDSVGAGIRLDAWGELKTNDYLYAGSELMRIQDLPPNADSDCSFFSSGGRRLGQFDTTPTHHSLGEPLYKVAIHPPGTTFPPNGFPVFTLFYRNDDGGPGYGRDSRILFDPPADGTYQVRIRDARGQGGRDYGYRLTVRPPQPRFEVRFTPTAPAVWKGGSVPLAISAERIDGYEGPIRLHFEDLPPGISAPPSTIEAETFTTTVPLFAAADAALGEKPAPWRLVAEATIDGKTQRYEARGEALKLSAPGDLMTTTQQREVAVKPGETVKLDVSIERRNGFTGRVPLEVRGLPHGVHVLDIGLNGILVNEGETSRSVTIYAEPWVMPSERPIIVLARREGTNAEHGAAPVALRVVGSRQDGSE